MHTLIAPKFSRFKSSDDHKLVLKHGARSPTLGSRAGSRTTGSQAPFPDIDLVSTNVMPADADP